MNHRTIDQISEGQLHDGAHLFSPGSEDGCVVVRDDPRMSNTEIQQNRPLLLKQISYNNIHSRVEVKRKSNGLEGQVAEIEKQTEKALHRKNQSKYSHDKMGPEEVVDPQKGNITKELIHLVLKI